MVEEKEQLGDESGLILDVNGKRQRAGSTGEQELMGNGVHKGKMALAMLSTVWRGNKLGRRKQRG